MLFFFFFKLKSIWKTIYFLVEITVFNRSLNAEDKQCSTTTITHLEHIYLVMLMINRRDTLTYNNDSTRWSNGIPNALNSNKTWKYRNYKCLSITREAAIYQNVGVFFYSRLNEAHGICRSNEINNAFAILAHSFCRFQNGSVQS